MSRDSNPFATRYTRPGAMEYLFPAAESVAALVERLRRQGWWGEIIGPHGSGKSTLLAALVPVIRRVGRTVVWRQLRASEPGAEDLASGLGPEVVPTRFSRVTAGADDWNDQTLFVLDGYEQLAYWWRRRLQSLVRRRGAGLLVTAHQPLGLPLLATTEPSEAVAQEVVARLLAGKPSPVTAQDVSAAFARTGGNLRETLFALYDVHRSRP